MSTVATDAADGGRSLSSTVRWLLEVTSETMDLPVTGRLVFGAGSVVGGACGVCNGSTEAEAPRLLSGTTARDNEEEFRRSLRWCNDMLVVMCFVFFPLFCVIALNWSTATSGPRRNVFQAVQILPVIFVS